MPKKEYSSLDKRKIFLFGDIDDESVGKAIKEMISLASSNKDVYLYICSDGGCPYAGLALIDTMRMMNYDINTIIIGSASSMAAVIALCGSKGKRFITRNSTFMYHSITDDLAGTPENIKQNLFELQKIQHRINRIVSNQTGKGIKRIKKDIKEGDFYLNAKSSIAYGAMDHIWNKTMECKSNK